MEGYYDSEYRGKGLETPTGQLNIEVNSVGIKCLKNEMAIASRLWSPQGYSSWHFIY